MNSMQSLSALLKCSQNIVFIEIRPKQVLSPVFNGVDLIQEKKCASSQNQPLVCAGCANDICQL